MSIVVRSRGSDDDVSERLDRIEAQLSLILSRLPRLLPPNEPIQGEMADDDELSIDHFRLSVRAYTCLSQSGLRTAGEVRNTGDPQLLTVKNLGKKTWKEIRDVFGPSRNPARRWPNLPSASYFK